MSVLLTIVSTSALMGCVTHHWVSPPFAGSIASSNTGAPVSGVEISRLPKHGEAEKLGESDSSGHFKFEAKKKTVVGVPLLVYLGDYRYTGKFIFKKEGYIPLTVDYSASTGQDFANPETATHSTPLKMTPNPAP